MIENIRLYIVETAADRKKGLAAQLAALEFVTICSSYQDAVSDSGGLDARIIPLMMVLEWGSLALPAPLYTTRVITIPDYEVARGMPLHAIPGVAVKPFESLSPTERTRLTLRESCRAIHEFNDSSVQKLKKIGASSQMLGLDGLKEGEAAALIIEAWKQFD
jgi:hypothetical protein